MPDGLVNINSLYTDNNIKCFFDRSNIGIQPMLESSFVSGSYHMCFCSFKYKPSLYLVVFLTQEQLGVYLAGIHFLPILQIKLISFRRRSVALWEQCESPWWKKQCFCFLLFTHFFLPVFLVRFYNNTRSFLGRNDSFL